MSKNQEYTREKLIEKFYDYKRQRLDCQRVVDFWGYEYKELSLRRELICRGLKIKPEKFAAFILDLYENKQMSSNEISEYIRDETCIPLSNRTIQKLIRELGMIRSKSEATKLAIEKGRKVYEEAPNPPNPPGEEAPKKDRLSKTPDLPNPQPAPSVLSDEVNEEAPKTVKVNEEAPKTVKVNEEASSKTNEDTSKTKEDDLLNILNSIS